MSRARQFLVGNIVAAIQAALGFTSAECGDVSPEDIMVRFSEDVNSPTADYLSGVTIKLNAVTEAFESGVRQTDNRYVLYTNATNFSDPDDVITWEYDDDFGDIEDDLGSPMGDITAESVENRVGMHFYFDNAEETVWVGAL